MSFLDLNKIIAAFLLAIITSLVVGIIAKFSYMPKKEVATRGYQVEIENPNTEKEPVKILSIAELMLNASLEQGQKKFKQKCANCHVVAKNGKHGQGPKLWGILGDSQARWDDFNYSKGFRDLGGSWDYDNLFEFLKKPSKYVKGTKMLFNGFRKREDIANVVLYLRAQSDAEYPLPELEKAEEQQDAK